MRKSEKGSGVVMDLEKLRKLRKEMSDHLQQKLIPFWESLKDEEYGGYYGYMDYDLRVDKEYEKGCILNSRILWFFSAAYRLLGDVRLRRDADHAWEFLRRFFVDAEHGGVYWSVTYDGKPLDTTKHTYNQAFAVYALSAYYDATGNEEALMLAGVLQQIIENKCVDEYGYLEALDREFHPQSNEKLSENGVIADKTMNTVLHVFEAYTEYYRVTKDEFTAKRLRRMLDLIADKIYNPAKRRQEVFFDKEWNSLIDLHSYGHDIETSWLVDRGLEVLGDDAYAEKLAPITRALAEHVYERAYRNHSLLNECERGVDDGTRVWWVQAEAVVGFMNAYEKETGSGKEKYLDAAREIWAYINRYLIDKRVGSEWFWCVDGNGTASGRPIVEPWKCPYHNGRMCMEIIRRTGDAS